MIHHAVLVNTLAVGVCLLWATKAPSGEHDSVPDPIPSSPAGGDSGLAPVDFAPHVKRLRQRLRQRLGRGHARFSIVVQAPFVVVGDETPSMVRRRANGTIRWAVDLLRKDFFPKDPLQILDIYLFKNRSSYEANTVRLFGELPSTPYGFYSDHHRALVMNIATGGGTLVHEIVHPFMEANFPGCPPWLNEGLGSLYEQSGQRGGKIVGFTNWRLPGLQRAIRRGNLPSFGRLMAQSASQFYNQDPGTHYSQSRYLLYYLQQRGLLRTYYRQLVRDHRHDPSGYRTLQRVLAERDMAAFQRRWEAFVLGLRY